MDSNGLGRVSTNVITENNLRHWRKYFYQLCKSTMALYVNRQPMISLENKSIDCVLGKRVPSDLIGGPAFLL